MPAAEPQAPGPINFWGALSEHQRSEFRSIADERSFAAGARLMREGETADHVMVILQGQVAISAASAGPANVIAHRGPGQLVGERAILDVKVRSATVDALELVSALVMTTEDFARFVTDHRSVLNIIQGQIDERRAQDPARYRDAYLQQA